MHWRWSCPTVKSRQTGWEKSRHRINHHHHQRVAQWRTSPRSLRAVTPRILRLKMPCQNPRSLRAAAPRILRLKPRTEKESTQTGFYPRFLRAQSCRSNPRTPRNSEWRKMDQITSWAVDGGGLRMNRRNYLKRGEKADIIHCSPNSEEKS